jgi:glutamyl-tRNA reductase
MHSDYRHPLQRAISQTVPVRMVLKFQGLENVYNEVSLLVAGEHQIDLIPIVTSLKDRLETIRCSEITRSRRQIGKLSPEQEGAIESLIRGIVNNIIGDPISTLRKVACDADASAVIDIVIRLFDLPHERYQKAKHF